MEVILTKKEVEYVKSLVVFKLMVLVNIDGARKDLNKEDKEEYDLCVKIFKKIDKKTPLPTR